MKEKKGGEPERNKERRLRMGGSRRETVNKNDVPYEKMSANALMKLITSQRELITQQKQCHINKLACEANIAGGQRTFSFLVKMNRIKF